MKSSKESTEDWEERKEKLKRKFAILNERDVFFEVGKQEEMIKRLQVKLGKTRDEILKIINFL
jgi:hypothetical protein